MCLAFFKINIGHEKTKNKNLSQFGDRLIMNFIL